LFILVVDRMFFGITQFEGLDVTYALEGDASINVGTQVAERAA
jgi:hypothetical protein